MAKPIISWLDDKLVTMSKLQFSSDASKYEPVVADTESVHKTFYIANNFKKGTAAGSPVYDATNCQLRVIDASGGLDSVVVKEKWLWAKCVSGADGSFTNMGGTTGAEVKLTVTAGNSAKLKTIEGKANDGNEAGTGQYNVAKIEAYIKPLLSTTAEGGKQSFRLAFIYSYGAE